MFTLLFCPHHLEVLNSFGTRDPWGQATSAARPSGSCFWAQLGIFLHVTSDPADLTQVSMAAGAFQESGSKVPEG